MDPEVPLPKPPTDEGSHHAPDHRTDDQILEAREESAQAEHTELLREQHEDDPEHHAAAGAASGGAHVAPPGGGVGASAGLAVSVASGTDAAGAEAGVVAAAPVPGLVPWFIDTCLPE